MPFVTVGQENSAAIQLYYEDHGSGSPVVRTGRRIWPGSSTGRRWMTCRCTRFSVGPPPGRPRGCWARRCETLAEAA
jgi:hypothetical protein